MRLLRNLLICTVLLFVYGLVMVALVVPYGAALAGILAVASVALGRKPPRPDVLGSAKWATAADVPHLLRGSGVIVGEIDQPPVGKFKAVWRLSRTPDPGEAVRNFVGAFTANRSAGLVRLSDAVHVAVIAPSGAGKGRSVVIPHLMETPDTVIVLDVKGELAAITAEYRRRKFGQKVLLVDPFGLVTKSPHGIDVMAGIHPQDSRSFDDARAVADAIVVIEQGEHDPHWPQRARAFITFGILAVVNLFPEGRRTLQSVVEVLSNKAYLERAITAMKELPAHGGLLARLAHEIDSCVGKERDGVLSVVARSMGFLNSPAVVESTNGSNALNVSELEAGASVYLVIPPEYLNSHAALLRLWVTFFTRWITRRGVGANLPVSMVLDECAQLGKLAEIESMLTIGRGFGLSLLLVFQAFSQVKKVFGENNEGVLLANTSQLFFGIRDKDTAEYVSAMIGDETVTVHGGSANRGWSTQHNDGKTTTSYSGGTSSSWGLQARRLIKPEELLTMPERAVVCLHKGCPPIYARLVRYDEGFGERKIEFWTCAFNRR